MASGIYQIRCLANGKRYIGSSVDTVVRWGIHRTSLKHSKHQNAKLQACWDKYGASQFVFEILEEAEPGKLMAVEQVWLDKEKPELNINPRADAPMRGMKATPEHRAKISAGMMGRPVSEETRAAIALKNRGNKSALGCKRSDEFKECLRARMTPDLKAKLSRASALARERRCQTSTLKNT